LIILDKQFPNKAEILRNYGADLIELRCPVFDYETSNLLVEAGVVLLDQNCQPDFVFACSSGDLDAVDDLLDHVDEPALASGLIAAASRGHTDVCRTILDKKSSAAHYVDCQQWNALRSAACNNHIAVLDMLIEYGIDVDECGNGGRTALRAAAWSGHEAIVERLLQSKADVDKKDSEGRTALMAAAFMDHFNIVSLLLKYGADPNLLDSSGATALHLALANCAHSEEHNKTVAELLNGGSNVDIEDANGRNCVHLAAYHGDDNLEATIERCRNIDTQDHGGRTALMLAACQGKMLACQKLIEHGADIDCIDNHGRTALILAAIHANLDICQMCISLGADEGHKDNDGAVALHYAAMHADKELVRLLCTPTTVITNDCHGNHPLLIAAQHPNVDVVAELLNFGAPIHVQSHDGQSALRIAALAHNEGVVRCLVKHILAAGDKTDLEEYDLDGTPLLHTVMIAHDAAMSAVLLDLGTSTAVRDAHARTCAHVAAQINDLKIAELVREYGGNFESRDEAGRTPLMTAVWASNYEIAHYMLESIAVSPNAVDFQGATALNIAAQIGHRDLVVLLLKFGAEPSLCDNLGRNAADVAQLAGHEHIRQILKSASGSADSSGFGSLPTSPSDQRTKSLSRRVGIATNPKYLQGPKIIQRATT
uniref:ANK_REP_REGION domain-containing protein n=1 Tax=Ascaris lumbricoides TaxID=6252 RepID=A0A9J2PTX4_ASCLU